MSSKKSHARRREASTIQVGALLGHRYFPFGDNSDETAPKPGYLYQDIGGARFSVLRPYEVNTLAVRTLRGEWCSFPYLLHFTDDWLVELAEILARGGFRTLERDALMLAALYHVEADNDGIARAILSYALIQRKCTADDALNFAAVSLADGIQGEGYEIWACAVQSAQKVCTAAFAAELSDNLPSKDSAVQKVKI